MLVYKKMYKNVQCKILFFFFVKQDKNSKKDFGYLIYAIVEEKKLSKQAYMGDIFLLLKNRVRYSAQCFILFGFGQEFSFRCIPTFILVTPYPSVISDKVSFFIANTHTHTHTHTHTNQLQPSSFQVMSRGLWLVRHETRLCGYVLSRHVYAALKRVALWRPANEWNLAATKETMTIAYASLTE